LIAHSAEERCEPPFHATSKVATGERELKMLSSLAGTAEHREGDRIGRLFDEDVAHATECRDVRHAIALRTGEYQGGMDQGRSIQKQPFPKPKHPFFELAILCVGDGEPIGMTEGPYPNV